MGYADFLRYTLPYNVHQLDRVLVLTDHDDLDTPKICSLYPAVECIKTDVWTYPHQGVPSTFNKGRGLNVALDALWRDGISGWICALDADIILPPKFGRGPLEDDCLYSCRRRLCYERSEFDKEWDQYPLEPLPQYSADTGMWGNPKLRTGNAAGLYGYLQLWSTHFNVRFPTQYPAAHSYDVRFGMSWPSEQRKWLTEEALHLGWPRTNWNGRVTATWT